jgi:hypothetical protein
MCECVRCDNCDGLGRVRTGFLDDSELCDECSGTGVSDVCDECRDWSDDDETLAPA